MKVALVPEQCPAARRAAGRRRARAVPVPFPAASRRQGLDRHSGPQAAGQEPSVLAQPGPAPPGQAATEPAARVRQYQAATAPGRAAPGLSARGRPAARLKADRPSAQRPEQEPSVPAQAGREPLALARAGPAPSGRAGESAQQTVATERAGSELLPAAEQLPAAGFRQARWKAGRAEVACGGLPVQARGVAPPARTERPRAAGQEPSATARSAGRAMREARSDPGPGAAEWPAPSQERAVHLAGPAERPAPARASPDGAAAQARSGWPEAPPAARRAGAGRSGPLQPGVPA